MPVYEVSLFSTYNGQNCLNRFNYISSGIPSSVSGSFGLTFALGLAVPAAGNNLFRKIKDMLSQNVLFVAYKVANLYDPEDFNSAPFGSAQPGAQTGESLSPVMAYGFRSNQVTTAIARGTKRFVGVPENDSGPNGIVTGPALSGLLQPVANLMGETLTYDDEGNTLTYTPCVLGRQEYTTPSGKVAYRKWPTEAEQLAHAAIGVDWEPYNSVRSQVSRQYGRGA